MNGGEALSRNSCMRSFAVEREAIGEELNCPYCSRPIEC